MGSVLPHPFEFVHCVPNVLSQKSSSVSRSLKDACAKGMLETAHKRIIHRRRSEGSEAMVERFLRFLGKMRKSFVRGSVNTLSIRPFFSLDRKDHRNSKRDKRSQCPVPSLRYDTERRRFFLTRQEEGHCQAVFARVVCVKSSAKKCLRAKKPRSKREYSSLVCAPLFFRLFAFRSPGSIQDHRPNEHRTDFARIGIH